MIARHSWRATRRLLVIWLTALAFLLASNQAEYPVPIGKPPSYPAWWYQRGVIARLNAADAMPSYPTSYSAADDYAAINDGQLKHLATAAFDEFDLLLPGRAGPELTALVLGWFQHGSDGALLYGPSGERLPRVSASGPYVAINLGQLKNVAAPFYDRLNLPYPWLATTRPADDYALANLGQAKNLFSFDPASDDDGDRDNDGLPDAWEIEHFGAAGAKDDEDPDGDGYTNREEALAGTDPNDPASFPDADHDGVGDKKDLYPTDSKRSEDLPMLSYMGVDVSSSYTTSVNGIALGQGLRLAFWYEDASEFHSVCWSGGISTKLDCPKYRNVGSIGNTESWRLFVKGVSGAGVMAGDAQRLTPEPGSARLIASWSTSGTPEISLSLTSEGFGFGGVTRSGCVYGSSSASYNVWAGEPLYAEHAVLAISGQNHWNAWWTSPRAESYQGSDDIGVGAYLFWRPQRVEPLVVSPSGGIVFGRHYIPAGLDLDGPYVYKTMGEIEAMAPDEFGRRHLPSDLQPTEYVGRKLTDSYERYDTLFVQNDFVTDVKAIAENGSLLGTSIWLTEVPDAPEGALHPFFSLWGTTPVDIYSLLPQKYRKQIKIIEATDLSPKGDLILLRVMSWEGKPGSWVERSLIIKTPKYSISDPCFSYLVTADAKPQQVNDDWILGHLGTAAKILLPFEVNSDLNNDGKVGEGTDSSLKTAGMEDTASEDANEKATEYLFVNDQLSNGAWDKEHSDPNKPASEVNDDDAEELKTICAATLGAVWFEYEGGDISKLAFYKTKECKPADKVTFPFALSETNKLPEKLFVRAEGDWSAQVQGKLLMKLGKADKSETWATDKLRFTTVKEVGNTKYFHAARDYMLEQNTRLHVRYFKSGSHEIRITAMRHESTDMKVIETYQPNPKIYGMPDVVNKSQDYYDLILNGNFVFFEDGANGNNKAVQTYHMTVVHDMTNRCYGGCVVRGAVSPASAATGGKAFQQPTAKFLSANGKGTFGIAMGVVPLNPPVHKAALGGYASNLLGTGGGNFYNVHPWIGIAEIGPESERKKLILTVTTTAATTQYPVADLMQRLSASGVPPFTGDVEPGRILCVAGDGGTSNATAHRIESDITRVKFAGTKHYSGHYWVNTYVGFESDKPRP